MLVVLRGEVFRQVDRRTAGPARARVTAQDPSEQLAALKSVERYVLAPARLAGWSPAVAADLVVAPQHREGLIMNMSHTFGQLVALRLKEGLATPTQLTGWLHTLQWVRSATFDVFNWMVLLILRADLAFKMALPLPPSEVLVGSRTVFAPFQISERFGARTHYNHTRISDVMLLVAHRAASSLQMALETWARTDRRHFGGLHDLADHYAEGSVGVLIASRHDSNSMLEWNPLYRLVGRPEAARVPLGNPRRTARQDAGEPSQLAKEGNHSGGARLSNARSCTCLLHVHGTCRHQPKLSGRFFELRTGSARECHERQAAWSVTCGPSARVMQQPCGKTTTPWPQVIWFHLFPAPLHSPSRIPSVQTCT